jgi:hypothetical protein
MQVLVINSGSPSVKFRLLEVVEQPTGELTTRPALLQGAIKGIGGRKLRGDRTGRPPFDDDVGDSGPDLQENGMVRPEARPRLQSSGDGAFAGACSKDEHR